MRWWWCWWLWERVRTNTFRGNLNSLEGVKRFFFFSTVGETLCIQCKLIWLFSRFMIWWCEWRENEHRTFNHRDIAFRNHSFLSTLFWRSSIFGIAHQVWANSKRKKTKPMKKNDTDCQIYYFYMKREIEYALVHWSRERDEQWLARYKQASRKSVIERSG